MAWPKQSWQYYQSCVVERSWKTLFALLNRSIGPQDNRAKLVALNGNFPSGFSELSVAFLISLQCFPKVRSTNTRLCTKSWNALVYEEPYFATKSNADRLRPNFIWRVPFLIFGVSRAFLWFVSVASADALHERRIEESWKYSAASFWTSMMGVFLGILTIIFLVLFVYLIPKGMLWKIPPLLLWTHC